MSENRNEKAPDTGLANDLENLRRQLVLMAIDQSGGEALVLNNKDLNTLIHFLDCYSDNARELENLAYSDVLVAPGEIQTFTPQQEEGTNVVRLIPKTH